MDITEIISQKTKIPTTLERIIFTFDKGVNNRLSNVPCSLSPETIVDPKMMDNRILIPINAFINVIFTST